jgi:acyl-CoA thioester hydrolase
MTQPQFPTPDQLEPLPCFLRKPVPEEYLDAMGHMNVRHYLALFDDAAWEYFASFGMDYRYYESTQNGVFALQQFINYRAEVHRGDVVAVRSRLLGRSAKRIHLIHFLVNETQGKLAATMEVLGSHVDLNQRRTSPFPPALAANIDAILKEQNRLGWDAPLCGVIRP